MPLPQWFAAINEKYSTPANSIVFLGVMAAALALSGSFVRLAIAASLTRLLVYVICIAALPVIKSKASPADHERAYRLIGGYSIPLLALGICLWMISHSTAEAWQLVGGLFAAGLVVFWLEQSRIKRLNAARG